MNSLERISTACLNLRFSFLFQRYSLSVCEGRFDCEVLAGSTFLFLEADDCIVPDLDLQAPNVTCVGVIPSTGWATVGHSTCPITQRECRFNYPGYSKVV